MHAAAARASAQGKSAEQRVAAAESSAAEWRQLAETRAAELLELRGELDADAEQAASLSAARGTKPRGGGGEAAQIGKGQRPSSGRRRNRPSSAGRPAGGGSAAAKT